MWSTQQPLNLTPATTTPTTTTAVTTTSATISTLAHNNEDPATTQSLLVFLLPFPALLLAVPLMLAIIVVSVGGNVMVLMSFKRGSLLAHAQSLYLLNLAVSDFLISAVCMPLHLVSTLFSSKWLLGPTLCKLYTAVQLTLLNVTTLMLVLVALDGLFQANMGVSSTLVEVKRRANRLVAACWVLAAAVHVPETLLVDWVRGYSVVPVLECRPEIYLSPGHVLFLQTWDFFLPVLVLSVVNTKLYLRLKSLSLTILSCTFPTLTVVSQPGRRDSPGQKGVQIFAFTDITVDVPPPARFSKTAQMPAGLSKDSKPLSAGTKRNVPTSVSFSKTAKQPLDFNESAAVTFSSQDVALAGPSQSEPGRENTQNTSQAPAEKSLAPTVSSAKKITLPQKFSRLAGTRLHNSKRTHRRRGRSQKLKSAKKAQEAYAALRGQFVVGKTSGTMPTTYISQGAEGGSGGMMMVDPAQRGGGEGGGPLQRGGSLTLDRPHRLRRVAVILLTLVLILLICWVPYSVAFIVTSFCGDCVSPVLYGGLVWLLYCKSAINPFLYAYNTFAFRNQFRRLLACVLPVKRFRRIPTDRVSNERASILN